ncbi:MSCRAMM family adhesin [Staphylococcus caledonicus]|uniref:LPXTG cell wall anchor domain-containing protein n=1 Tax=Staphylococcus sp. acrmy TaxID=2929076 RepID=UPI001F58984F|nr:LPXTG cell wall anchor domain-containing protein [Staphylococcus sp. acrmy]MCI2947784.1 MSCRAMM family adhesin [Staphylococcus sp. acrmy]
MKKGLIATTLAGTVLATGIFTGQAHAAEQKTPVYVFTEKEFNENKTGATEGFGGGPGSDVRIVVGDETYQEYLNRVKAGEELSESAAPIEYVYPNESQDTNQTKASNNGEEKANMQGNSQQPAQVNENQTNANHQASTSDMPSNTNQQQMQSNEASVLPETGVQQTGITTIIAAILGVAGSILLFSNRKHQS